MNEKTPENNKNAKNRAAIEKLKKKAANLIEKIRQQEKENQNNTANPDTLPPLQRINYFKYHSFASLSKIRSIPYKEWMGETINDEIVVVNYKNGSVVVGAGFNEIKARQNMELVCETRNQTGALVHNHAITINDINEMMKLEWKIPADYIEE